ncbi:MAG TPA: alkaline phosphatase family protein, partial [Armatimonadota bacterium]|nr:alkaline phosphatase family protein [Armatimonadota bacterium]
MRKRREAMVVEKLRVMEGPSRPASPDEVLRTLRRTAPEPGMVLPDYSGYSICNVAHLVLRNFGLKNRCPDCLTPLLDRKYRRIVLMIVDALGWNQLHRWMGELPSLKRVYERAQVFPLTVTFPSTTTVALTALYTGLTPVEHTITGHNVYLREVGSLVDVLRFSPYGDPRREVYAERGVDVHKLFPMYTVFEPLRKAGLDGLSITRGIFTNTALGWLHHVGADVTGYLHAADLWVHLKRSLHERSREGLTVVYWDVVDMLSHEYGPFSEVVRNAIDHFFYLLERTILEGLPERDRADTLLLITADHGQCDSRPDEAVLLSEQPRLNELLMLPPAGQSRAAYLYAGQGDADALGQELQRFDDSFRICRSEEALRSGLFGPPEQAGR